MPNLPVRIWPSPHDYHGTLWGVFWKQATTLEIVFGRHRSLSCFRSWNANGNACSILTGVSGGCHIPAKDGTVIRCLIDLEIGDMATQARLGGPLVAERQRLDWLRRVRNALAHSKVVPWGTLTSPIAVHIADFRE